MSDIVERLEQHRRSPILVDAKNEIERLREANELNRNCKLAVVIAKERIAELEDRTEKLETVYDAAKEIEFGYPPSPKLSKALTALEALGNDDE